MIKKEGTFKLSVVEAKENMTEDRSVIRMRMSCGGKDKFIEAESIEALSLGLSVVLTDIMWNEYKADK